MKFYDNETLKLKLKRRKKVVKVLDAVLWILTALVLVCVGTVLCQKFLLKKNIGLFGYTPFIVSSGSMQPDLQVHDMIVVKHVSEGEISSGDVISFYDKSGDVVTHRVREVAVRNGKTYYLTKGDANNIDDPELTAYENVIGRYSFRIPGGGHIVAAVTSPVGIAFFMVLFIFICVMINRKCDRREARHSIREKYKESHVVG